MWRQAIVLGMIIAMHETCGELALGVLGQCLMDLHLRLVSDDTMMRLVKRGFGAFGHNIKELCIQRRSCLIHNDTGAVCAARTRRRLAVCTDGLNLKERTAEPNTGGQPVTGFVGDTHVGDKAAVPRAQIHCDVSGFLGCLKDHCIDGKLRAFGRVGHRVSPAHPHFGAELAQHFDPKDVETDKTVPTIPLTEGHIDVILRQKVCHGRQVRVLNAGDLSGDRRYRKAAIDAQETRFHVATLTGPGGCSFTVNTVDPLNIVCRFYRMLEVGQRLWESHAVFSIQEL